ncbi:replicative DNA helicase [Candidatus Phytoplasma sacchari]|nr:replicative DNA helicase [Candidatus Phytoplasma sacchari]KAB8121835.1 replicative DNA helicase [Candidatus Phytoplasma sacchari]
MWKDNLKENYFKNFPVPYYLDAEQAVLGILLLDGKKILEVISELKTEDFFNVDHQKIYQAMKHLFQEQKEIDYLSVFLWLKNHQIQIEGDQEYLLKLGSLFPSVYHLNNYLEFLKEATMKRKILKLLNQMVHNTLKTEDVGKFHQLIERSQERLNQLISLPKTTFITAKTLFKQLKEIIQNKNTESFLGWKTGFRSLDEIILGYQPESFIILAARPGIGKTTFMLNMIWQALEWQENLKTAIFSLEMNNNQLGCRSLSMKTQIAYRRIQPMALDQFNQAEKNLIEEKIEEMSAYQLFLDDEGLNTMTKIKEKCRWLKKNQGLNLVFVDYLQLLKPFESEKALKSYETVSQISRELKLLAKELKICIVCLSQLSREIEKREDKRPKLADLRDSGSIEQDADVVMFLARNSQENHSSYQEIIETNLIIAKNRHGQTGEIPFNFYLKIQKFQEKELY